MSVNMFKIIKCKTARLFDHAVFRNTLDGVDLVRAVANTVGDSGFFEQSKLKVVNGFCLCGFTCRCTGVPLTLGHVVIDHLVLLFFVDVEGWGSRVRGQQQLGKWISASPHFVKSTLESASASATTSRSTDLTSPHFVKSTLGEQHCHSLVKRHDFESSASPSRDHG